MEIDSMTQTTANVLADQALHASKPSQALVLAQLATAAQLKVLTEQQLLANLMTWRAEQLMGVTKLGGRLSDKAQGRASYLEGLINGMLGLS